MGAGELVPNIIQSTRIQSPTVTFPGCLTAPRKCPKLQGFRGESDRDWPPRALSLFWQSGHGRPREAPRRT